MHLQDKKVDICMRAVNTTPNTVFLGLYFPNDPAIGPDGWNEAFNFEKRLQNNCGEFSNTFLLLSNY